MQHPSRHSPKLPREAAPVVIETPSWRQFVPNFEHDVTDESDGDPCEEVYINKHHQFAVQERLRWANPRANSPSNHASNPGKAPKSTTRLRTMLASNKPAFPTPKECFEIVRGAVQALHDRAPLPSAAQSAVTHHHKTLEQLETTLASYAQVEESLQSARKRINSKIKSDPFGRDSVDGYNGYGGSHLNHVADFGSLQPLVLNPPIQRDTYGGVGAKFGNETTVMMMNKQAFSTVDFLDGLFRKEAGELKSYAQRLARQAGIPVPEMASFQEIHTAVVRGLGTRKRCWNGGGKFSFQEGSSGSHAISELIRGGIDEKRYPLLARRYELHEDYCLTGTRKRIEDEKPWASLDVVEGHLVEAKVKEEPRTTDRNGWESLRMFGGSRSGLDESESEDRRAVGRDDEETKGSGAFDQTDGLGLDGVGLEGGRRLRGYGLDNRRLKLRQNVKRKLPRIHTERRTRKAYRFRASAESISSRSSGGSSDVGRWSSFLEDGGEGLGVGGRQTVAVQFHQGVDADDADDKEDGTDPSVEYVEDGGENG